MQEPPRSTTSVPTQEESRSMVQVYSAGEISQLKINMVPVRSVFTATLSCFSVVFEPVRLVTFCHGDNATYTCMIVWEITTTGATIFKKTTPNQLLASSCWGWYLWLLTPMVRPQWPRLLLLQEDIQPVSDVLVIRCRKSANLHCTCSCMTHTKAILRVTSELLCD